MDFYFVASLLCLLGGIVNGDQILRFFLAQAPFDQSVSAWRCVALYRPSLNSILCCKSSNGGVHDVAHEANNSKGIRSGMRN